MRRQNPTLSNGVYSPKILVVFLSHSDKIWLTALEIPVVATRNRAGHYFYRGIHNFQETEEDVCQVEGEDGFWDEIARNHR